MNDLLLDRSGRVLIGLCVVVVPLVVLPGLVFPFVTSKALVFRTLVALTVCVGITRWARQGSGAPRAVWRHPMALLTLGLAGWLVVASANAPDPVRSVWGSAERMEGGLGMLTLGLFAACLAAFVGRDRARWRRLALLSLAVSAVVGATGFLFATDRWSGLLGSPTYLSLYVVLHGIGAAAIALSPRAGPVLRVACASLAAGHAAVLWQTQTRGALLAAIAAGMVALLIPSRRGSTGPRIAIAVGLIATVPIGFLTLRRSAFVRDSPYLWRFGRHDWLGDRPALYKAAVSAISERPLLGWGLENTDTALHTHAASSLRPNLWADRTHDIFLDVAVQGGLPALSLAIAWLIVVVALACSRSRTVAQTRWMVASLTAWCVATAVSFPDITAWMALTALATYAVCTSPVANEPSPASPVARPHPPRVVRWSAVAVLMAVGAGLAVDHARQTTAHRALLVAADVQAPVRMRLAAAERAYRAHPMARAEAASLLTLPGVGATSADRDGVIPLLGLAARERPYSVRLAVEHARVLAQARRNDAAIREILRAEALAATTSWLPLIRVPLHLRRGELSHAEQAAQRAVALSPTDDAVATLAALLLLQGERDAAQELLLVRADKRSAILLDVRVFDAARRTGQLPWLAEHWHTLAEQDRPAFREKLRRFLAAQP